MTFHDEVHRNEEHAAYLGARHLVIWLKTIAPVNSVVLERELIGLAEIMCWPTIDDPTIGKIIK